MACMAGSLQLAKMLVDARAGMMISLFISTHLVISAANDPGDTPLLAVLMAGNIKRSKR